MDQPLDIFKREDRRFVWCGTAKSLVEANAAVKLLGDTEFIIVNEDSGERIFVPRSEPSHQRST